MGKTAYTDGHILKVSFGNREFTFSKFTLDRWYALMAHGYQLTVRFEGVAYIYPKTVAN